MVRNTLFVVLTAVFAVGCSGSVNTKGGDDDDDSSNPDNPVDNPDMPDLPDNPVAACKDSGLGQAPLRRLTRTEYFNSVRDLLPGVNQAGIDLPLDTALEGFENRAHLLTTSPLLIEQQGTAAVKLATAAAGKASEIMGCNPSDAACGGKWVESFGARVFRRPLADDEKKAFTDFFNKQKSDISPTAAFRLTLEAFLQAPQFLYRFEFGDANTISSGSVRLTHHELATRLSYLLWGTTPDADLLKAADDGALGDTDAIAGQVDRMLKDDKARAAMVDFHRQWWDFDRLQRQEFGVKDTKIYPTYTDALKQAMREEADRLIMHVMFWGDGSLGTLLSTNEAVINKDLAKLYGAPEPKETWGVVTLPDAQRAGYLTRANFLASQAHGVGGSPPLRAVFIMRRVMCQAPPDPPGDVDTSPPANKPNEAPKTNRQLFEERLASNATCAGCHRQIDPIGYGLEHYDAIGAYRDKDNGIDVDASGKFQDIDVAGDFYGGVELSKKLAESDQVKTCATGAWFSYAFGRDTDTSDECKIEKLGQALADANGDIRQLLLAITKTSDFQFRPEVTP